MLRIMTRWARKMPSRIPYKPVADGICPSTHALSGFLAQFASIFALIAHGQLQKRGFEGPDSRFLLPRGDLRVPDGEAGAAEHE